MDGGKLKVESWESENRSRKLEVRSQKTGDG